ncbi:hypothetical protein AGMMS50256_22460 [Betaproteobacteria bacterium]|nr:hypothetical protein AGMMS50256_22460 [Betaproteobacteria bacterium]
MQCHFFIFHINRLKSELTATISHETRTPLAVLSGYAELIASELKAKYRDAQMASDLDRIADETQRIAALMLEIQNFSKEKADVEQKTLIFLEEILRRSASLCIPILQRNNVALGLHLPDKLPSVYANSSKLTQVMFNLLQNAKKHSGNGAVEISAVCEEGEDEGEVITATVSDTGTGIPAEILPRIWERGVSGEENGAGLRLPIGRDIIYNCGGTIAIESEPGQGTIVRFTIPAADGLA